jgi:ketosteroid isomerase-like protein
MSNADVIRGLYAKFAAGDIPGVLADFAPDIVWNEAENFPYADQNPYEGPEAVLDGVFARLGAEWDGWTIEPDQVLDAGDTVVALGRYRATCKATGKAMNPQMVHVWTLSDGKVVRFQQYVDTKAVAEAME